MQYEGSPIKRPCSYTLCILNFLIIAFLKDAFKDVSDVGAKIFIPIITIKLKQLGGHDHRLHFRFD